MLINQISFINTLDELEKLKDNHFYRFFSLLKEKMNLSQFISADFYYSYYRSIGRDRSYSLTSFLYAFILMKFLGITQVSTFIAVLHLSPLLLELCEFEAVPDSAQFSRFKNSFDAYIHEFMTNLAEEAIHNSFQISPELASMLIYDTSAVVPRVQENNPKFLNGIIKNMKGLKKINPKLDPYAAAYNNMPSHASANAEIAQVYANGIICYGLRFAIITNGLGIPLDVVFLDDDFKKKHPEIDFAKKEKSPDEDKSIADSVSLKPVLTDFFSRFTSFKPTVFLGDSAFDTHATYPMLIKDFKFSKVVIPENIRNTKALPAPGFNESGHPLCPFDNSLPMKYEGLTRGNGRADRIKWSCPKTRFIKGKRVCFCNCKCTDSQLGRMFYTYPDENYRMYPGLARDTEEWIRLYKIRVAAEKTINLAKTVFGSAFQQSLSPKSLKTDVYFSVIAQILTALLAVSINETKHLRSARRLMRKVA
mgnify:CR=1 FL=1